MITYKVPANLQEIAIILGLISCLFNFTEKNFPIFHHFKSNCEATSISKVSFLFPNQEHYSVNLHPFASVQHLICYNACRYLSYLSFIAIKIKCISIHAKPLTI